MYEYDYDGRYIFEGLTMTGYTNSRKGTMDSKTKRRYRKAVKARRK